MLRNRVEYIMRVLHVIPKSSLVYDREDLRYDPIGQVHWLVENLLKNYQAMWNASEFLCIDESLVAYNDKFYTFKQYLLLKPMTHGIKILHQQVPTSLEVHWRLSGSLTIRN